MTFDQKVYEAVKKVPRGKVASYGYIAAVCGNLRAARAVGNALHRNSDPENVPCYRIVGKDGKTSKAFAFGGADVQRILLEKDGVSFDENGRVLKEFFVSNETRFLSPRF